MKSFQKILFSLAFLLLLLSCNTDSTNQIYNGKNSSNAKKSLNNGTLGHLDSIVTYDAGSRRIIGQTEFIYDASKNLKTETLYEGKMFDNWSIILRTEYDYKDSLKTQEVKKRFNRRSKKFVEEHKKTFQYDTNGMLKERNEFYWQNQKWNPQSITTYEHDTKIRKIIAETTSEIKEGKKIKTQKSSYSYNDKGEITHATQSNFIENKWVINFKSSFDYKANLPYQRERIGSLDEDNQKTVIVDNPSTNTKSIYYYMKQKDQDWHLLNTQTLHYDPAFPNTDFSSFEEDWTTVKTDSSLTFSKDKLLSISHYFWSTP